MTTSPHLDYQLYCVDSTDRKEHPMNPPNRYKRALELLCIKCKYHGIYIHGSVTTPICSPDAPCPSKQLLAELIPEYPIRKDEEQC